MAGQRQRLGEEAASTLGVRPGEESENLRGVGVEHAPRRLVLPRHQRFLQSRQVSADFRSLLPGGWVVCGPRAQPHQTLRQVGREGAIRRKAPKQGQRSLDRRGRNPRRSHSGGVRSGSLFGRATGRGQASQRTLEDEELPKARDIEL